MSLVEDGTSSESHVEGDTSSQSVSHVEVSNGGQQSRLGNTVPSVEARQRRRIAQLEGRLETLESGRAVKERYDGTQMNSWIFSQSDCQAKSLLHGSRKGHQAHCCPIR